MTFGEQIWATFMGAFLAFIFAIFLFFLTNWVVKNNTKKEYRKLLRREFRYNISWVLRWKEDLEDVLRKIGADDNAISYYFKYTFFQVYFLNESFKLGIVYDLFKKDAEIAELNHMLGFFGPASEKIINDNLTLWINKQIDKKTILKKLDYDKRMINRYLKFLNDCINDFKW